jgi:apolipoprotein N-acyltransferase
LIKFKNILFAVLSGIFLGISWYEPFTLFIFIGFVPLFAVTNSIHNSVTKKKALKIWSLSYFTFFTWNVISTWWIYNASIEGAVMAIVCNALLMSWVYLIWYKTERRIYGTLKFWLLIPIWLAWEYGHTLWDLSWTWLSIGNSFANLQNIVQWYELTGVSGGSLWVLSVTVLLTKIIIGGEKGFRSYVKPVVVIVTPILISLLILSARKIEPTKNIKVTVIQPNIDPYDTKFVMDFNTQLAQLNQQLLQCKLDKKAELVVLPETFIIEDIIENDYKQSLDLKNTIALMRSHFPKAAILTGASSIHIFSEGETKTATARKFSNSDQYYDSYNTAVYIDTAGNCSFYHKSKLVPGVERMPFPAFFHYFERFAIELGGTSGSLATQDERTLFSDDIYDIKLAPSICYESVYGDFMGSYCKQGASVIAIITNDGWWGNTPGHKQHLSYAKLRAIESRKQIIRSANTGISCFIDEFGKISQAQPYWEFAVINQTVALNNVKTFFVRFGDVVSYTAVIFAIGLLGFSFMLRFRKS